MSAADDEAAWGTDPDAIPREERLAAGEELGAEDELDTSLRPRRLDDFIGQDGVKQQLAIFLRPPRSAKRPRPRAALWPSGAGQDPLARIIADEMGVEIHITSGPVIERTGDLAAC